MEVKEGSILREKDTGRIFYIAGGRRHWILSQEAAVQFRIPLDQAVDCMGADLQEIPVGSPVVNYPQEGHLKECSNHMEARAYLARGLTGSGIECGPGPADSCYPLPLNVQVSYLDKFGRDAGCNQDYQGEYPEIDYMTTIDKMEGIEDGSLDFIIQSNVIEHSKNPVLALGMAYRKLKAGGTLIMAVPDKRYTFDKARPLTKIRHLIQDLELGEDPERNLEHVYCCHKIWVGSEANQVEDLTREQLLEYLKEDKIDIHWHTFTDRSFAKLLRKLRKEIPWSDIRIVPRNYFRAKQNFLEFYVILKK